MSTEWDAATLGIEADELAALEQAVLRGLQNARLATLAEAGSSAAGGDAPEGDESVGERQGRQPVSANVYQLREVGGVLGPDGNVYSDADSGL